MAQELEFMNLSTSKPSFQKISYEKFLYDAGMEPVEEADEENLREWVFRGVKPEGTPKIRCTSVNQSWGDDWKERLVEGIFLLFFSPLMSLLTLKKRSVVPPF